MTDTEIRAYSVGHFMNDLCAALWMMYLNYYLLYVVGLTQGVAAAVFLTG